MSRCGSDAWMLEVHDQVRQTGCLLLGTQILHLTVW